jgi:phage protein D
LTYSGTRVVIELLDYDLGDLGLFTSQCQFNDYLATRLISLRYHEKKKEIDRIEIVLRNDDFKVTDQPALRPGQKLLCSWGWIEDELAPPVRCVIKDISGGATLTIIALSMVTLMDRDKVPRREEMITDSEFVRKVAGEYGYTGNYAHIQETKARRRAITQPAALTDARMLHNLAKRNGFDFSIKPDGMHWHEKKTDQSPIKTVRYGVDPGLGDILESPEIKIEWAQQVAKVRVFARDPITKEEIEEDAGPVEDDSTSLGAEDEMGDVDLDPSDGGLRGTRVARVDVRNAGLMTRDEAKAEAMARYKGAAIKKYQMGLRMIGDRRVSQGCLINVSDVGETLDGLYYVDECIHEVAGGMFTQQVSMERDAMPKVPTAKKRDRTNVNQSEAPEGMSRVATVMYLPTGECVPAWTWVDPSGRSTGQIGAMTSEEIMALTERQRDELFQMGAQSVWPDSCSDSHQPQKRVDMRSFSEKSESGEVAVR